MNMPSAMLLKGGTVLVHDVIDSVNAIHADLLVEGNKIQRIAAGITAPADAIVIDCSDKILSPGFIDTHHHVWNTQLRGRHANQLVLEYAYAGIAQSSNYTPEDIFWGQLGGCMEMLDAGTTTVVDHAHMNYSPDHAKAGIAASSSSGIREIFGYCPTMRVDTWSPFSMKPYLFEPWVMDTLGDLAKKAPFGSGRVSLAFAFDGWFLPKEMIVDVFAKVKDMGIKLITTHYSRSVISATFRGEAILCPSIFQSSNDLTLKLAGQHSVIALMDAYGILDSSVLFSHANNASDEDAALVKAKGAHVSSTPSTELQMGLGDPVCFNERLDWQSHASLGIDCHNNNATSMPSEMRVALSYSRGKYHESFARKDRFPLKINKTVQDAFNLGTINGARAIGMGDSLGSLTEGKLADIVIFDCLSPSMVCGAQQDPVAAIVLNSSPADIAMTIVDGVVSKANHKLCDIELSDGAEKFVQQDKAKLTWAEVATELLRTRKGIVQKIDALDFTVAREGILALYQTDQSKIVAKV